MIKNYDDNDTEYFLEVGIKCVEQLVLSHNVLPFSLEKIIVICMKNLFVMTKNDRKSYVVHIKNLKQTLNHGLKLGKAYRMIRFNKKTWLKPHIDMNTNLRKNANNDFEKNFFKLMNNLVFGKTMDNARERRDIKLVTKD